MSSEGGGGGRSDKISRAEVFVCVCVWNIKQPEMNFWKKKGSIFRRKEEDRLRDSEQQTNEREDFCRGAKRRAKFETRRRRRRRRATVKHASGMRDQPGHSTRPKMMEPSICPPHQWLVINRRKQKMVSAKLPSNAMPFSSDGYLFLLLLFLLLNNFLKKKTTFFFPLLLSITQLHPSLPRITEGDTRTWALLYAAYTQI